MTDSALDIKYKRLMNKYYSKENKKLFQIFLYKKIAKPFIVCQRSKKKKKLILSSRNYNINQTQQANSVVKSKNPKDFNKNKFILKRYKSLSINTINKDSPEKNKNNVNDNKNLVSSDILQEKSIFLSLRKQFSINSLINTQLKENKEKKMQCLKKNISQINLKKRYSIAKKEDEKKGDKKLTRFALRNNLYFKYSSILSGGKRRIKNNDDNENEYYYRSKKTDESNKQHLTISEPNKNFNFNNIYKRNLNLPNIKINKQIINNDGKIYLNCLFSKINSKLNANKIINNNNVKTIYNIQNEHSYKRIHLLDKIFSKLMKHK